MGAKAKQADDGWTALDRAFRLHGERDESDNNALRAVNERASALCCSSGFLTASHTRTRVRDDACSRKMIELLHSLDGKIAYACQWKQRALALVPVYRGIGKLMLQDFEFPVIPNYDINITSRISSSLSCCKLVFEFPQDHPTSSPARNLLRQLAIPEDSYKEFGILREFRNVTKFIFKRFRCCFKFDFEFPRPATPELAKCTQIY